MKAAEIVKKYGIKEGENKMVTATVGILWRETREGSLIPVTVYIPGNDGE